MSAFEALHDALTRAGSPAASLLAPGVSDGELARVAEVLPFPLPDELVALHRWHDGLTGEAELFPGGHWLSLAQALEHRTAMLDVAAAAVAGTDVDPDLLWGWAWWPAFVDFAGGAFVVACELPGAPVLAVPAPGEAEPAFDGLGSLLAFVAEGWRSGVFAGAEEPVTAPPPDPGSPEGLRAALHSGDAYARALAARQLGALRDADSAEALLAAIADPAPDVRAQAIGGVGSLKFQAAVPALIGALGDEDVAVRIAAARVLAPFKSLEAVPALVNALDDHVPDVRRLAAAALARVKKDPAAREALEGLLSDDDPIVRSVAEKAV